MNISDIARLAGVAPATVSRYLNNGYVSAEKKEKIRRIIAETGYSPRSAAPAVRTDKSNLIAVIVPHLRWDFVSAMVEGITEELSASGCHPLLVLTGGLPERELEQLRLFLDHSVDGVIFYSRTITEAHSRIITAYNKPIVVVGQYEKDSPCVYFDDYKAAYTAVRHLASKGCRRIAHIYTRITNNYAGRSRMDGCYDALKDLGLSYADRLMSEAEFSVKGGRAAMQKILASGSRFDGLFCASDSITIGALGLLSERGINIPDDLKVLTVGSGSCSVSIFPSLTYIRYNYGAAGREACKILLERINGDTQITKQYKLGFELIERESTR